jgi:hypothetical protein
VDFVGQIDTLTDREVIWQSYTDTLVAMRAPQSLSSLCFRGRDFWLWMTKTPHIHDMYVECVLRQFGLYQACLCLSHTPSTLPCTCKFIPNLNSFFGRVKKVSLLTNLLFFVAGGRGRGRGLRPFFGEAAAVPRHVGDRHAERRHRAALTRRRRLESVPAVVHGEDPDARDLRSPNPRLDLMQVSTYPYRRDQSHNILVSSFPLIQNKSHPLKFHYTNNPSDLNSTTQLRRCTTWPNTWARRWTSCH